MRVAGSESSVCGDAQSLINSGEGTCRRSIPALRYVAKLIEGGYTDSEIGEKLANRYRPITAKKIDLADAPMKGSPSARSRWSSSPITNARTAGGSSPCCTRSSRSSAAT